MPSFDLLQDHLAARDADSPTPASRTGSRIIASEELGKVIRFAMRPLSSPARERTSENAGAESTADRVHIAGEHRLERDSAELDTGVWQPEYATGHKAGLAEGFRRGFDAGVAHANAMHDEQQRQAGSQLAERMEALIAGFHHRLETIEREIADQVVAMALDVARHALRATLAVQPETIIPVVQEALTGIIDDSVRLHLHLNPGDEALVRTELGPKLTQSGCEIIADPAIQAGGCRIETARAEIDATVETRWRRTLAALGHAPDGAAADPGADASRLRSVASIDGPSVTIVGDSDAGLLP